MRRLCPLIPPRLPTYKSCRTRSPPGRLMTAWVLRITVVPRGRGPARAGRYAAVPSNQCLSAGWSLRTRSPLGRLMTAWVLRITVVPRGCGPARSACMPQMRKNGLAHGSLCRRVREMVCFEGKSCRVGSQTRLQGGNAANASRGKDIRRSVKEMKMLKEMLRSVV